MSLSFGLNPQSQPTFDPSTIPPNLSADLNLTVLSNLNPTQSGRKYQHRHGHTAIRDGIKYSENLIATSAPQQKLRKPPWIRVRLPNNPTFKATQAIVSQHELATVCQESHCPNIGECWSHGTATFMLMGDVCTRACKFCAVDTGNPQGWLDPNEPHALSQAVALMKLKYVVLTSVDRDDLPLGGAGHYAECVREILKTNDGIIVEALTPDFQGEVEAVQTVLESGLHVFAHNIETVRGLTPQVRDPRATYEQSLNVLKFANQSNEILTKTGLMLGLGETENELQRTFDDLVNVGVELLTLGQYLQPTRNHLPVRTWVTPDQFDLYRDWALATGFKEVAAGPLVRSSYRADRLYTESTQVAH